MGNATAAMRDQARTREQTAQKTITAACDAALTTLFNVVGSVEITKVRLEQRQAAPAAMPAAAIRDNTGELILITAAASARANLLAAVSQVANENGPWQLRDGATIRADLQGTGATAHNMVCTIGWRALTRGATVTAA